MERDNELIKLNGIDSEISYFSFVLGYDLLQDKLNKIPCDDAYDICVSIASDFVRNSEEYKNLKYSGYDMLIKYIDNNIDRIWERINDYDWKGGNE